MPSRSASNGRHGSGDTSSSELKPNSTLPHKRVDAADHRRIDQARAESSARPRRTPWRSTSRRSRSSRTGLRRPSAACTNMPSECGVCTSGAALVGGKRPSRVELGVGIFGFADARCRRADHQRDALGAVALARGGHRVEEAIRLAGRARPAGCCGNPSRRVRPAARSSSRPSTRPIQVASGRAPKSLARSPLRDCRARRPWPPCRRRRPRSR